MGKNNKPYSYEEVKSDFEKKGYELISKEYKNKNTKLEYICNKHKGIGIQYVSYASLKLNKCNCKECIKENSRGKSHKYPNRIEINYDKYYKKYQEKLYNEVKDEYELIKIFNNKKRIVLDLIHKNCNNHYITEQYKFFNEKCRCQNPECKYKRKRETFLKTTEQFKKEIYDLVGDEYEVIDEYIGKDDNIRFLHKKCNCDFVKSPHNFLAGQRCPHCIIPTKGEKRILDYLNQNNIKNTFQKSYDGLVGINGNLLSYDFYLDNLNILIEYQGNFHDGSVGSIMTEEKFERQQEHDRRKREYAKNNDINLLEIWYWNYENIEKILSDYIK